MSFSPLTGISRPRTPRLFTNHEGCWVRFSPLTGISRPRTSTCRIYHGARA